MPRTDPAGLPSPSRLSSPSSSTPGRAFAEPPRSGARRRSRAAKKIATIEGITEYRLDNGLRVLLFPDASTPKVTVNMTVFVGSRHEGYGETGMAHLLEHMLFKGTPDRIRRRPQGACATAAPISTAPPGWTAPIITRPCTPPTRTSSSPSSLEADRLVNSFVRREDLASEMTVVRNEFEQGENSPQNILSQRMMAVAFEWHNYGKSTIGNRSDIERVPIEKLQAFYHKYYQPDNVMLIVAGKFDEAKALALISKYFGTAEETGAAARQHLHRGAGPGRRTQCRAAPRRHGRRGRRGVPHPRRRPSRLRRPRRARNMSSVRQPSGRLYKALVEGTKKATNVGVCARRACTIPASSIVLAPWATKRSVEAVREPCSSVLERLREGARSPTRKSKRAQAVQERS